MLAFFLDEIRDFLFDCFVLRWIGVGWGGVGLGRSRGCWRDGGWESRVWKKDEEDGGTACELFSDYSTGGGMRERWGRRKVVSRGLWR